MRPQLPDYGTFTHWPDKGHARIHPDDVAIVNRLIPSDRVFRRRRFDGVFYEYHYGREFRFRLRPSMWLPLRYEGFDVGDRVEVSGLGMVRQAMIARIVEMRFSQRDQQIQYTLQWSDAIQPRSYVAEEMRLLTQKVKLRQGTMGHPAPQWQRADDESLLDCQEDIFDEPEST